MILTIKSCRRDAVTRCLSILFYRATAENIYRLFSDVVKDASIIRGRYSDTLSSLSVRVSIQRDPTPFSLVLLPLKRSPKPSIERDSFLYGVTFQV